MAGWNCYDNYNIIWDGCVNAKCFKINNQDIEDLFTYTATSPITLSNNDFGFDFSTNNTWTGTNTYNSKVTIKAQETNGVAKRALSYNPSGTEKLYIGNYLTIYDGIVSPSLQPVFFGLGNDAASDIDSYFIATSTALSLGSPTNINFQIGLATDEMVLTANELTFNNGANDTAISWATNGQLDFKVSNGIEMSLIANELIFNNGATTTALNFAGNGQLDFKIGSTAELKLTANNLEFNSGSSNVALNWGTAATLRLGDGTTGTSYIEYDKNGALSYNGSAGQPYGEIYVEGNSTSDSVSTATWTQVTRFANVGNFLNTTPSAANDDITIVKAGNYLVTISISFSGDASVDWKFSLFKNNGATQFTNVHCNRKLGSGGDIGSASLSGIVNVATNDTLELWMYQAEGVAKSITIQDVTMSIVQVGGPGGD